MGDGRAMGSGWADEQSNRADTDPPLPKVVEVAAGEWYALPAVTEWAITDLAFDVVGWLLQELADEYSENVMSSIVSGAGNNKPTGFLGSPAPVATSDAAGRAFGTLQYIASGLASALPATTSGVIDLLLDVVHSLRWKHRQNAHWTMSALTMSALRKYKDADGRPILLDSMISGQPATLLGYPLVECEAMPNVAAGAFPIAFGNFDAGYVLDRDAGAMRITRDDITTKGFVKFYARTRVGGKVLDSEAIKLVKIATS
ncbi:phage major capsid protein [Roseateles sp. LKC17W]|uniref:Phage major capsid protein n=2 Tax=Pelomonas margarita TaxID=3299031 RepID=A0ABW7FMQ3_9BURK